MIRIFLAILLAASVVCQESKQLPPDAWKGTPIKQELLDLSRKDKAQPRWDYTLKTNFSFMGDIGISSDYLFYTQNASRLVWGVNLKQKKLDWAYDQLREQFRDASQGLKLVANFLVEGRRPLRIQMNQGVVLFHDPDLFKLTAADSSEQKTPFYNLPLSGGSIAKALGDTNNKAFVVVTVPGEAPFDKIGLTALEVKEGKRLWHFGGEVEGLSASDLELQIPEECKERDLEPLERELLDLKAVGNQACGPEDKKCKKAKTQLKQRKREVQKLIEAGTRLSQNLTYQAQCEELIAQLQANLTKLEKAGGLAAKEKELKIQNPFSCKAGCNEAEVFLKVGLVYVNLNNTAYFVDEFGETKQRLTPKEVEKKCKEVDGRLWWSTSTFLYCWDFNGRGLRYIDPQSNKMELKVQKTVSNSLKELAPSEVQRLVPADDRIYKIVNNPRGPNSAVGIGIVSGEVEWDFECSLVQEQSGALGPCNVLFMCTDPKIDQVVVGCGMCGGFDTPGFTVVVDRADGRDVYGYFEYDEDYTRKSRCIVQTNIYESNNDGNDVTTLYYRQGFQEDPLPAPPTGGKRVMVFTVTNETVRVSDDLDYSDQFDGAAGPQDSGIDLTYDEKGGKLVKREDYLPGDYDRDGDVDIEDRRNKTDRGLSDTPDGAARRTGGGSSSGGSSSGSTSGSSENGGSQFFAADDSTDAGVVPLVGLAWAVVAAIGIAAVVAGGQ